jgi:PAS domain S-box-containing protein
VAKNDERGPRSQDTPTIDLGIAGRRVPVHSHIAYLWKTGSEFAEAVGFVEAGLQGADHCVVVGDERETATVLSVLTKAGFDVEALAAEKRLVLVRPAGSAREMLDRISTAFEEALSAGAPVVRLFGNVGWDRRAWPPDAELAAFEAHLNEIAEKFESVLLCLHELPAITGLILRHGVLGTHPTVLDEGDLLANPLFIPFEQVPERLPAVASDLSRQQQQRTALRREAEILQAIFDNIPVMISFRDPAGNLLLVNREWERVLGWKLEDAQPIEVLNEIFPEPESRRKVLEGIRRADHRWTDFRARTRDGRTITTSGALVALSDGTRLGFGVDVTERRDAETRLRQSTEKLRALSERLRVVREEERTQMAREVHDEIGQALTAVRMDVAWLERKLAATGDQRTALESKLRSMAELVDTTLLAVQRIATELRPGILDELGLEAAIEWYLREFEQRTGIACRFRSELGGRAIDPGRSTAVFRILQEALTNVARHSEATRSEIDLSSDGGEIRLEVRDNGRGIVEDRIESSGSLGLVGMRERARSLGGDVKIQRAVEGGTTVTLTIPL